MLSFNALLRVTLDVHHAELTKTAWLTRAAHMVEKQSDFEKFVNTLTGEDDDDQPTGLGINDLMRNVGSF